MGALFVFEGEGALCKEGRGVRTPGEGVNKALLILAAACLFMLDSLTACRRVGQQTASGLKVG